MNRTDVRTLQRFLKESGSYQGKIDGLRGPKTLAAMKTTLKAHADLLPAGADAWSDKRRAVACLQVACRLRKIEVGPIDGLWGPHWAGSRNIF